MKPLAKILFHPFTLTLLVLLIAAGAWIVVSARNVLHARAELEAFDAATAKELLTSELVDRSNVGYPNPEQVALSEKRAIAGFRARLEAAHRLADLDEFAGSDELFRLWDLPQAQREQVLAQRREQNERALRRAEEAAREMAQAYRELREALGEEGYRREMERALEGVEP